jgi:flagellar biosynthesis/type III secretory pathway protein FliH
VKKRTKTKKEEQRLLEANAFNEGFQMGYAQGKKEGYKNAMHELSNNNNDETTRPASRISHLF